MGKTRSYKEYLLEQLQDAEQAAAYINAALEEDDPHMFLMALRDVAEAQGGMTKLARKSQINRESLYRTLSARGNPRYTNLKAVLNAVGMRVHVDPDPGQCTKSCAKRKTSRRRPQA